MLLLAVTGILDWQCRRQECLRRPTSRRRVLHVVSCRRRIAEMSATHDMFLAQKRLDASVHFEAVRRVTKMSPFSILHLHIVNNKLSLMDMNLTVLVNIFVCLTYCHHFVTVNIVVNVIIVTVECDFHHISDTCDFYCISSAHGFLSY